MSKTAMVSAAQLGKDRYIVAVRLGRGTDAKQSIKRGIKSPETADRIAKETAKNLESKGYKVTLTQMRRNRTVG